MKNFILLGAGAERALGIPTTVELGEILKTLCGFEDDRIDTEKPLRNRMLDALKNYWGEYRDNEGLYRNLELTLKILHDGDCSGPYITPRESAKKARDEYISSYKENCLRYNVVLGQETPLILEHYLHDIGITYDWLSFKSLVHTVYKTNPMAFDFIEFLNIIYQCIYSGLSIPTPEYFKEKEKASLSTYYADQRRLIGTINVYKLLIYKIIKGILYNSCKNKYEKFENTLNCYSQFFYELNRLHFNAQDSHLLPFCYVSYNWTPILLFLNFMVNKNINDNNGRMCGEKINFCTDNGIPISSLYFEDINKENLTRTLEAISENVVIYVNELYKKKLAEIRLKIYKYLSPHGAFNLRRCPKCSALFMFFPKKIGEFNYKKDLYQLFLIDPIPSSIDISYYSKYKSLTSLLKEGIPDKIKCPFCGSPTYFEHVVVELQTIFKLSKHHLLQDVFYQHGLLFSQAEHIISIGYSFPQDDMQNLLLFKTMAVSSEDKEQKLSMITKTNAPELLQRKWFKLKELEQKGGFLTSQDKHMIENVKRLFKEENIRISFKGFPGIIMVGNEICKSIVELLEFK